MKDGSTIENLSPPPSELAGLIDKIAVAKEKRDQAQAEIAEAMLAVRQAMASHVGRTMLMEGQASRYFGPSDSSADISNSHGFEDGNDWPIVVTTGMRPLTIEKVEDFGIVVSIDGETKRPVLKLDELKLPED